MYSTDQSIVSDSQKQIVVMISKPILRHAISVRESAFTLNELDK